MWDTKTVAPKLTMLQKFEAGVWALGTALPTWQDATGRSEDKLPSWVTVNLTPQSDTRLATLLKDYIETLQGGQIAGYPTEVRDIAKKCFDATPFGEAYVLAFMTQGNTPIGFSKVYQRVRFLCWTYALEGSLSRSPDEYQVWLEEVIGLTLKLDTAPSIIRIEASNG